MCVELMLAVMVVLIVLSLSEEVSLERRKQGGRALEDLQAANCSCVGSSEGKSLSLLFFFPLGM